MFLGPHLGAQQDAATGVELLQQTRPTCSEPFADLCITTDHHDHQTRQTDTWIFPSPSETSGW